MGLDSDICLADKIIDAQSLALQTDKADGAALHSSACFKSANGLCPQVNGTVPAISK
jgi:hypothetical protein